MVRPKHGRLLAAAAAALLGGCVPRVATPPPAPAPVPAPVLPEVPVPRVPPPPAPVAIGWEDGPLSLGDWHYSPGAATFTGPDGAAFSLRCVAGRVEFSRAGAAGAVAILTSFGARSLTAEGGTAALAASDPLFDQMAFSRGRFLVRADGAADLVAPAWPEVARLVEDCRGQ
jgi:hypothetical protein